jgi:hypothetical protein
MSELNVQYLQSLEDHINAVQTCEDLQKAVDTVMNALGDQLQALTDELEIVGAIQELLEIPNNLQKLLRGSKNILNWFCHQCTSHI